MAVSTKETRRKTRGRRLSEAIAGLVVALLIFNLSQCSWDYDELPNTNYNFEQEK